MEKEHDNNKPNVMFIRLVTGEDLISEVSEYEEVSSSKDSTDNQQYYILHNPMKVLYLQGVKSGFVSISLMQWVFGRVCQDQTFDLSVSDILTTGYPSEKMHNYYWNAVALSVEKDDAYASANNNESESESDDELDEDGSLLDNEDALKMLREVLNSSDKNGSRKKLN
jgi:hypothetical protein